MLALLGKARRAHHDPAPASADRQRARQSAVSRGNGLRGRAHGRRKRGVLPAACGWLVWSVRPLDGHSAFMRRDPGPKTGLPGATVPAEITPSTSGWVTSSVRGFRGTVFAGDVILLAVLVPPSRFLSNGRRPLYPRAHPGSQLDTGPSLGNLRSDRRRHRPHGGFITLIRTIRQSSPRCARSGA